jgi:hypothetical protein
VAAGFHFVRKVDEDEVAYKGQNAGQKALDYKDPAPGCEAAQAVLLIDELLA